MLAWKLRISVLWIFVAVVNATAVILLLSEPGPIGDLTAGQWLTAESQSEAARIGLAINMLVPMVMAFLTVVLRDTANRWTNGVVGSIGSVSMVLNLFGFAGASLGAGLISVAIVGTVVGLLIVWHAWKWPESSDVAPPQRSQERARVGA